MSTSETKKTGFRYTPHSSRPKSLRINRLLVVFTLLRKSDRSGLGGSDARIGT
jgi:hypothetical protein